VSSLSPDCWNAEARQQHAIVFEVIGTCGESIPVVIVARLVNETVGGPAATAIGNSITHHVSSARADRRQPVLTGNDRSQLIYETVDTISRTAERD
jgi:hypothetical protein